MSGTDWKAFAEQNTFKVEVGGAEFLCARPSATQLTARGVLPPALVLGKLDPAQSRMNGDRNRLLLDEKAQDALIDAVLIEPGVWDGPFGECPKGHVPRRSLAGVRDVLVVAILSQLYDTEVVRGAAFRDREGAGGDVLPDRGEVGPAGDGSPRPAGRRAGVRARPRSGRARGA